MKLIVISDTHGRYRCITEAIARNWDADALIFLGDGINDIGRADVASSKMGIYTVKGNCDGTELFSRERETPTELVLNFEGFRFFLLHGHTRSVKSGVDAALLAAYERGADVLLYGHTHHPESRYLPVGSNYEYGTLERPMYIFNPGSLGALDSGGSFGIIEIRNGNILFSHGTLRR